MLLLGVSLESRAIHDHGNNTHATAGHESDRQRCVQLFHLLSQPRKVPSLPLSVHQYSRLTLPCTIPNTTPCPFSTMISQPVYGSVIKMDFTSDIDANLLLFRGSAAFDAWIKGAHTHTNTHTYTHTHTHSHTYTHTHTQTYTQPSFTLPTQHTAYLNTTRR